MEITIDFQDPSSVERFRKFNPSEGSDKYDSLRLITDVIKRSRLLKKEEEIYLSKRIKAGDALARTRMIESNLLLVLNIAFGQTGKGLPLQDLFQEGVIGLIRACDLFDWEEGYRFSTYAVSGIWQSIQNAIDDRARIIRIPSSNSRIMRRVIREKVTFLQNRGKEATNEEISSYIGSYEGKTITPELITDIENPPTVVMSIEQYLDYVDALAILDSTVDESTPSDEERILEESLILSLSRYISKLELDVILLRIGFFEKRVYTYKEIANILGLSFERVMRVESRAYTKIRNTTKFLAELN